MASLQPAPQGAHPGGALTRPLAIVGGGEHARVVAEAASAQPDGWSVIGHTRAAHGPERAPGNAHMRGIPLLGTDDDLARRLQDPGGGEQPCLVLGFGGPPEARHRAVERYGPAVTWAAVVHPSAWVSPSSVIGDGAVILAGAVVNAGARVGAHSIVNSRVVIEHDVRVGPFAHVAPGATIGGGCVIGEDAFIGLGASVRDHVTIGAGAVVGMGAVVVADVPERAIVAGVPARPMERSGG